MPRAEATAGASTLQTAGGDESQQLVDRLVVRGVQLKDVRDGKVSSTGILSINTRYLRFKGAPTAQGDGERAVIPLHRVRDATKRGGGLMMGAYYIELSAWKGVEGHASQSVCHLVFGRNEATLNKALSVLLELVAAAKQVGHALPDRAAAPKDTTAVAAADVSADPAPGRTTEEFEVEGGGAGVTSRETEPVRVDFVATKELEPGVHVYTVNCEFSDGRVGRTEVPAPAAAPLCPRLVASRFSCYGLPGFSTATTNSMSSTPA